MAKSGKSGKVAPRVLKGFRDYPPEEEIARQVLIEKTRTVFERYGYLPLQTASLEFAEALLGPHYSDDNLKELFGFTGPDEVDMALRYEFTLSLARYVAGNPHLPLPFRRYQYGNVWRVDKPGPGRFREFMQFDFDIVGTASMLAVGAIRHVRRSRGGVLKADGPAFTLEQLRRLREQGEVTEPEYQALRQKVLAETNE